MLQSLQGREQNRCEPSDHNDALSPMSTPDEPQCKPAQVTVEDDVRGYERPAMQDKIQRQQQSPCMAEVYCISNGKRENKRGQTDRRSNSEAGSEQSCWLWLCHDSEFATFLD